jgi:4-carboxymuconolactone decarboxylase
MVRRECRVAVVVAMTPPGLVQPSDTVYDGGRRQVASPRDQTRAVYPRGKNTDMSETRFPPLTAEQMTDEQRAVVDAIQSGPRGAGLRGPFNALVRSPVLCDLVQRVGAYVRFGSSIPAPLNELAICMAGRKWGAQYEFYAHRRLGIDAGLNPAILDAVAAGSRPADMSSDEAMVYGFVSDLLSTGAVTDANYGAVLDRFGERGIMDLVGAVGYYSLVSMVLNVAEVPLPEGETPPLKPL